MALQMMMIDPKQPDAAKSLFSALKKKKTMVTTVPKPVTAPSTAMSAAQDTKKPVV